MSETFNSLLISIESIKYKFIDEKFKETIYLTINIFFPNLNAQDLKALQILTCFIIDLISFNYDFKNQDIKYINQWTQNSNRDIKGVILLLLPFIDDKDNGYLLKKIKDLNHLLYAFGGDNIPSHILKDEREKIKSTYFEYGNMGIGLIKPKEILELTKQDNLLKLYNNEDKLIYEIIHHNFIGLLQTLEIINGKCYINWVNISPLNLKEYHTSTIFNRTLTKIDEIKKIINENNVEKFNKKLSNNLINYGGLWIGDIYNILRTRYYEDAKKIKWLFFAYETSSTNKLYLIQGLNKMLDLNKLINNEYSSYEDISNIEKIYFDNLVDLVINNLKNKTNMTGNYKLDNEILKYMLIYLFSNYSHKNKILNTKYRKFILDSDSVEQTDDFTKEELTKIKEITNEDIINCLEYIRNDYNNHLWNFLMESIVDLENSAYGKFLIIENIYSKKEISTKYYWEPLAKIDLDSSAKNKINLKNIYNISKSLSHSSSSEWILSDRNYLSFNSANKQNFFARINKLIKKDWINLTGNLKRQFIDLSYSYDDVMNDMLIAFSNSYIYIIFEELVCLGILNKFTPNLQITDKSLLPQDTFVRKSKLKDLMKELFNKNKVEWLDSYYYLTNNKYKKLGKMRLDKSKVINPNDKYDEMPYFDIIGKDHEWPVFYAMDWISQISFFQHYIFHQVMYVTGATGQGKSTQVPKLLLYAMKCIDYKSNGKVICTQPRVPPTVGNATRIAEELGVPIEITSNYSTTKIKTNNFYVQFKHQGEAHTLPNANYNTLKIVTDGTLLAELKSNPTLKNNFKGKLINTNVYDIVIVDEAHEHNTNMDIIIALSKQACYVNNQVRLIVVSATMDDDEPIYRRYFYNINDKLLFPIKYPILHPFLQNKQFLPLPKYMDRRYHISPPGATTQYRVDEYYLETDPLVLNPDNSVNEKKSAEKAQELGYKKIIEICNKSVSGEILFFANGKGEILKAVKYLNSSLPPGNIALPYFAELNETYKNIISKINIKISTIRNRRDKIDEEWGSTYVEDISVPLGIYKRSIIIATNVAEASVTIPNLAYVVDNGYAKVNTFNPELSISKLGVEKISESSRVQRRGRAGRIGDGTVYYMYSKDARKFIKPKYKITQDDVDLTILSLMGTKNINHIFHNDTEYYDKLIVSYELNPNILLTLANININISENYYTIKSGLYDIIKQNYFINNSLPNKIYYVDPDDYYISGLINENNQMDREFFMWEDGQIFENVIDSKGKFYLIHPFENSIKRNILNNIIEYNNKQSNVIPFLNFKFIINNLQSKNLIVNANKHLYKSYNDMINLDMNFVKTELGTKVLELEMPIPNALTLISASAMNCLTEVYEINIFIEVVGSLGSFVDSNCTWLKFKEIYGGINSDLIFVYQTMRKLRKQFSQLYLFSIYTTNFECILNQHYINQLMKFKKISEKITEPPANYDVLLWNKLIKLKKLGKLETELSNELRLDKSTLNIVISDIEKYKSEILLWAKKHYFNGEILIKFMKQLGEYYLNKNILNAHPVLEWARGFNSNFNKYLTTYTIDEKIIRSFLYGKPNHFTFKLDLFGGDRTILNYDIFVVNINKNLLGEEETLIKLPKNFSFYLNYLEDEKIKILTNQSGIKITWLSQIEPVWLIPTIPLLFNSAFNDGILRITKDNDYFIDFLKSKSFKRISKEISNSWNQDFNIWDSEQTPILRDFYKSVTKLISRL